METALIVSAVVIFIASIGFKIAHAVKQNKDFKPKERKYRIQADENEEMYKDLFL